MRKFLKVAIAIMIAGLVSAGIFVACEKDGNEKITKSTTLLANPMAQWGAWHNECLEYMLSQPDAENLTSDELWINYGIPFFQNVLGTDYIDVPLDYINTVSEEVIELIKTKNIVSLIENSGIDADFTSPYISRNNYTILHEFFSYMDNVTVTTEAQYCAVQTVVKAYEQEILSNYYALLERGDLDDNPDLNDEYEEAMLCMAIADNSGTYWSGTYYINHAMGQMYAQIADCSSVYVDKQGNTVTRLPGMSSTTASLIAYKHNNWY